MTFQVSMVSKRYGSKWVLRDVSLSISRGSVFGILGEPGSGKSTLIGALSGRLKLNGGSYGFFKDGSSNQLKGVHSSALIVEVNSPGSLLMRRLGLRQRKDIAGISDLIGRVEESSANDIVFIDDVLSRFDDDDRERFANRVRALSRERGTIFVIASRRFSDIALLCDEATIIDRSHQLQTGTPEQLYLEPISVKSAILTGPVNLWTARRTTSTKVEFPSFHLIDSQQDVFARPTSKADIGPINQNVNLMIRPESVSISFGASFPEDNLLKGRIEAIDFRGSLTYVRLDSNGLKISASAPRVVGLNIGDECVVGLPPNRIHVLKS